MGGEREYQTRVIPGIKRTVKSGLNTHPRFQDKRGLNAGCPHRGLIMQTYATDAAKRKENRPDTTRVYEVECDVLLTKSLIFLERVPVAQKEHGVNDADPWIPRPAKRVIGGGSLNFTRVSARGVLQDLPPHLGDVDGDQVLVQFMEGDPEKPIITHAISHTKTKRLVVEGTGWEESDEGASRGTPHQKEKYLRYRGVEVRINDDGDVLLDTVGATGDEENETPATTGGQVRVRVKSTEKFTIQMGDTDVLEVWQNPTTGQVHVDLGEDASEAIVRGDKLTTWILAHMHPDATGGTAPPVDPSGAVSMAAGDHLSDDHKVK